MAASILRIVSRESALAMWQAEHIRAQLQHHHTDLKVQIIGVKTTGDKWQNIPLQKVGGKGLFVKELEQALLEGEADVAVHSLKDVPADFPEGLGLAAICERADPFDAWVCPAGLSWQELPAGSRVGTSSLRRQVQLQRLRPDFSFGPLRGNVDTRLRKCREGEWDAIILAAAGLTRLGLTDHITSIFKPEQLLPAVGQGALGLECRLNDDLTRERLAVLNHAPTRACVEAERTLNRLLNGNCQVPIAGFAQLIGDRLQLTGRVGHPKRTLLLEATATGAIANPEKLGEQVANTLIEQGAQQLIAEILADE